MVSYGRSIKVRMDSITEAGNIKGTYHQVPQGKQKHAHNEEVAKGYLPPTQPRPLQIVFVSSQGARFEVAVEHLFRLAPSF